MGRLIGYVPLHSEHEVTWVGPDDELSEDLAARIGEHAFEDGEHPYPEARAAHLAQPADESPMAVIEELKPSGPVPPPFNGPGSSKTAWAMYADEVQVDLDGVEDTRDAIVGAIRSAGKPVGDPPAGD